MTDFYIECTWTLNLHTDGIAKLVTYKVTKLLIFKGKLLETTEEISQYNVTRNHKLGPIYANPTPCIIVDGLRQGLLLNDFTL